MTVPPHVNAAASASAATHQQLRPIVIVALLAIILASTTYKYRAFLESPRFASQDDTGIFWSESAFHYRYARMIAQGVAVPEIDRDAQWPEGVAPLREFTMGMEYAAGLSYRALRPLLGGAPFHVYLAGFIAAWSSLSIAAAFFAARALWRTSAAGLVAALAYALSPASISRTIWNFVREDFTLPFLFASFAFFIAAWRGGRRSRGLAVGAAVTLALGLATWHLARFYLLAFALVLWATLIATRRLAPTTIESDRTPAEASALRWTLTVLSLVLIVSGVAVPVLLAKKFLLSTGFILVAALAIMLALWRKSGPGRVVSAAWICAAFGVAMAAARILPSGEGEYAHVSGLILAKLRFLGAKPDNPALLSDAARVFWVGPFNSPNAATALLSLSTMLLWGPASLIAGARVLLRTQIDTPRVFALLLALFFAASFLLVERMIVFLVFFAAILVPAVVESVAPRHRRFAFLALALLGNCEIAYLRAFQDQNPWRRWVESSFGTGPAEAVTNPGENPRLAAWVRSQIPERDAILTWFPTGPMVLTDTEHPVPLHSMFESSTLRAKERRMRAALYGTEEEMWNLCAEWNARYFLYQANLLLDTTKESYRYMADRMRVSTSCAAYLFHFHPEQLTRFTPVYQDSYFRLFRVELDAPASGALPPSAIALPYSEIFDPALLGDAGDVFPDERSAIVIGARNARFAAAQRAAAFESAGDYAEAARTYDAVLARSPDAIEALIRRALIEIQAGRLDDAESIIARARAKYPHYAELHFARGLALEARGRRDDAVAAYREALALSPGVDAVRQRLAFLAPGAAGASR
ncbi:MAG: tetratricopeptide repeat protein [bacterium]